MFATLAGTETGESTHQAILDQLSVIAGSRGVARPTASLRAVADGPLDGWSLTLMGPPHREADLLLAVTAPRVPGISPIFPVSVNSIRGPLFAVVVLQGAYCVSRADRRHVSEVKNTAAVATAFDSFLDHIAPCSQSEE